ncbi:uncharacterized protein LOC130687378 [Daphnia carinata]|uniref:uncharacterized protein LOC130687378 n=1 Tax=Daphnia carinata TaxID=120202 RepID=UPI00257B0CFC|nr:uncharacterized protein LOC130687378 [Daphnia carinata]
MKLLVYWWIFVVTLVNIQCRNSVNNLLGKRIRPFITSHTQSQLETNETTTQQSLSRTIKASPPTHSASPIDVETQTSLVYPSTSSAIKAIPAVAATTNFSTNAVTLSKNSSIVAVKSIKEDSFTRSTIEAVLGKADNVSFSMTQAATNNQDRFVMSNNPFNATQLFPKRPLRSQTINRYLAKAKEKAFGSSTVSPIPSKLTHVIVKRHFIRLMPLDDFVLDTDDV